MRALRLLAAFALTMLMLCAALTPPVGPEAWAQLPTPNPLVGPRPLPRPPAALPAPVPPRGVPSLIPVLPQPSATPTPRAPVFNCSCFGPGSGTQWMGRVQAPTYFTARQAAVGACLGYLRRKPQSPNMPPSSSFAPLVLVPPGFAPPNQAGQAGQSLPPGFAPPNQAGQVRQSLPGTLNFSNPTQLCSKCTCD